MPITHGIGAFPNSFLDGVWETGWQELYERFHWLRAMDGVRQDSVFHGEGDVLTHTKMVCEMLMQLPEWQQMDA
ncbi:MAG: poly(A) polymerase [Firmicutes bacterium]|nr:poly(A) polymerase [Bacillota bacterium]